MTLDAGFTGTGTISTAPDGKILLNNGATANEIEGLEPNNQGTIVVTGAFDNSGQTLDITSGTVEFQNTLTNTGGSIVVDGGTLRAGRWPDWRGRARSRPGRRAALSSPAPVICRTIDAGNP